MGIGTKTLSDYLAKGLIPSGTEFRNMEGAVYEVTELHLSSLNGGTIGMEIWLYNDKAPGNVLALDHLSDPEEI